MIRYILCQFSELNGSISREGFSWAFSLTRPGSMQIYWNKRELYYKKKVRFNSHGLLFIVLEHQDSPCNVMWKPFLLKYFYKSSKILQGERLYLSSTRPSFSFTCRLPLLIIMKIIMIIIIIIMIIIIIIIRRRRRRRRINDLFLLERYLQRLFSTFTFAISIFSEKPESHDQQSRLP